jgi:hypothetical protein
MLLGDSAKRALAGCDGARFPHRFLHAGCEVDTLIFEPMALRMRCTWDTTTPRAHLAA